MNGLLDRVRKGELLVCDGAMGTQLMALGMKAGECPEQWCRTHTDELRGIAKAYADAGADILETNSFGGNAKKLSNYGLADKVTELNRAAAEIAKSAIGPKGYVAGSVGPTGIFAAGEGGKTPPEDFYQIFRDQVIALADGGADAICVETMWSITEAGQAVCAAKENTSLPAICTFTFSKGPRGYRTSMGITPEKAAEGALKAGADVVGANCGNGIDQMIEVTKLIRAAHPGVPILIQSNAGLPVFENGTTVYKETPEYMASRVSDLVQAGASIVGGCCGTSPDHIRAMAEAVRSLAV